MNPIHTVSTLPALNLKDALLAIERTLIHSVLVACDWNQRKAAQALGVLPTTLSEKIYRLELHPPGDRRGHFRRAGSPRERNQPGAGRQDGGAPPRLETARSDRSDAQGATRVSVPAIEIAAQVSGWCASCGQDTREA